MNLLARAFAGLWPSERLGFVPVVKYSTRFRGYGAGIRKNGYIITASLSSQWKKVSDDIVIGLLQELLLRLLKKKSPCACSLYIGLYHNFVRGVHAAIPKTLSHPVLDESFSRVNSLYFEGLIEKPNLKVSSGARVLGRYDYCSDTLSITGLLLDRQELLDYVMYHELLHKLHKYTSGNLRMTHHSRNFRNDERAYPNAELLEEELKRIILVKTPKHI